MTNQSDTLFAILGCFMRMLTQENGEALQRLIVDCADYYELNTALPPGPAEAQSLFLALPPNGDYNDKFLIGVFSDNTNELIALMDVIRHYPAKDVWTLGLLMITPRHRGTGLGSRLVDAFERWVAGKGGQAIRLGVMECNRKALSFWLRQGFEITERRHPFTFGKRETGLLVLVRPVLGTIYNPPLAPVA